MVDTDVIAGSRIRLLVYLLFVIQLVSMGAMEMSGPFWPVHLSGLTDSPTLLSVASIGVYIGPMLGVMLTSAFWGRIGDRHGHKLMMIRALIGLTLTQLGLAFCNDVLVILVLRFVQGACAGYIAPAQAYGVSIEAPARRARLFAILQISTNVGSLLGAVIGGLILDYATFFWINFSAAVLCGLCTLVAAITLPNVPATPKAAMGAAVHHGIAWRHSPLLPLLGVLGILLLARMLPQTSFALYVSSVFAVRHSMVGLCYGLLATGFILSATRWSGYFEQRSVADSLQRMTWVVLACAVLIGAISLTRNVWLFTTAYFVWGALLGATTPVLTALISKTADSSRQGQVLGIAQSMSQFASITGICAGGLLSQVFGLHYTYCFVAIAYGLALLPLFALGYWPGIGAPRQAPAGD